MNVRDCLRRDDELSTILSFLSVFNCSIKIRINGTLYHIMIVILFVFK